ncbi:LacI family DNA-binding transcriptional regulator [Gordonia sinesedis]
MHDVAERLGVSISTVSRALRGLPGVSEETRRRIVAEAEAMAYVVSPAAATLGGGATRRVGVLVPDIAVWFYSTVVAGIERRLRAAGLDMVLACLPTERERFDFFEQLPLRRKVDALIVVSFPLDARSRSRLASMGIPVTLVGGESDEFATVGIDDAEAAEMAVGHLVRAGHRRIAMIRTVDPENREWAADTDRLAGYRTALTDAGIDVEDDLMVQAQWGIDGGAAAMEMLLSKRRPPTAVFCFSDEVAIGALRTLRRAGLTVPEAMSVVAVDDHPMAELTDLTTVHQPAAELGVAAADSTIEMLGGGSPGQVLLPTRLVVRHSTAACDAAAT